VREEDGRVSLTREERGQEVKNAAKGNQRPNEEGNELTDGT